MTKNEFARRAKQENTLVALGFASSEAEALRRISRTLRRWYELECGIDAGCIERDEATGKPVWVSFTRSYLGAHDARCRFVIPDREAGALRRLGKIMSAHPTLRHYLQTDPRGATLYILRPGDVPEGGSASSYYTRGICVY